MDKHPQRAFKGSFAAATGAFALSRAHEDGVEKFRRENRGEVPATRTALLVIVASLAATSVVYAQGDPQRKDQEKAVPEKSQALRRCDGMRLIARSFIALPSDPGLALLLAIEGAKRAPGLEANAALLGALEDLHETRTLAGHTTASFSPDGLRVVTGSGDRTASIWEVETGKALLVLKGHERAISAASFGPDGRRVVTGSRDSTARIWDAETGKEIVILRGHDRAVTSACFSADGRRVLTASEDKTGRIWDAETGKELLVLRGHEQGLFSASFSPDGSRVVTVGGALAPDSDILLPTDRTARIWAADTGKELLVLRGNEVPFRSASFGPDGKRVVTGSLDSTVTLWDSESGKEILVLRGHEAGVFSASFSRDGRRVLTASEDRTARIWDTETGKELLVLRGHGQRVSSASFSPDGRRVVTASDTIKLWDVEARDGIVVLRGHESTITSATFSPDGRRVVTASADKTARIWDAETGKEISVVRGHEQGLSSAGCSPDGRRLATSSADKTARIWDVDTGKEIVVFRGHQQVVVSATFSPDGRRVATCSRFVPGVEVSGQVNDSSSQKPEIMTVRVWDAETGKEIHVFPTEESPFAWITATSFTPDGRCICGGNLVARRGAKATNGIWDAETGKLLLALPREAPLSMSFSRDGRRVAAWGGLTAKVWDAQTAKELVVLQGHEDRISSLSFSPDGRRAVTASRDKTARIWDLETGKEILVLRGHEKALSCASFSPDGQRVVTGSRDQTARIWPLDLLAVAERRKPRDFTRAELLYHEIAGGEAGSTPDGKSVEPWGDVRLVYQIEPDPTKESVPDLAEKLKAIVISRLDLQEFKGIRIDLQDSDRLTIEIPYPADRRLVESTRSQVERPGRLAFMLVAPPEAQTETGIRDVLRQEEEFAAQAKARAGKDTRPLEPKFIARPFLKRVLEADGRSVLREAPNDWGNMQTVLECGESCKVGGEFLMRAS